MCQIQHSRTSAGRLFASPVGFLILITIRPFVRRGGLRAGGAALPGAVGRGIEEAAAGSVREVDEAAAYAEEEGYERRELPGPGDDDLATWPRWPRPPRRLHVSSPSSDAAARPYHTNIYAGALSCRRPLVWFCLRYPVDLHRQRRRSWSEMRALRILPFYRQQVPMGSPDRTPSGTKVFVAVFRKRKLSLPVHSFVERLLHLNGRVGSNIIANPGEKVASIGQIQ